MELPEVLKHDFLAKSQAAYLEKLKASLEQGEFIITMDFSENYSFYVQDAVQSQHWSNDQATLHVYVVYYKKNGFLCHKNFVLVSESVNHDATAVHLYNSKLISFLKEEFNSQDIKKFHYFSDGAGSQYKNRFNFLNLLYHERDFGVQAEWNFFATAHGKGACDGIGGCVKRNAYRASLQKETSAAITTTTKLFEWAQSFFKKIDFSYCSLQEYENHKKFLQKRFLNAKTIKNTRQFHCYVPIDGKQLKCKNFSDDTNFVIVKMV